MFSHMIILLQSFYLFVGVWLISTFFFFYSKDTDKEEKIQHTFKM